MRWFERLALATVLVWLALTGAGCPDSEFITPANGNLETEFRFANTGASRYDRIEFDVVDIKVEPVDPAIRNALGPSPIGVLNFPQTVSGTSTSFPTILLRAGQYRVAEIILRRLRFEDTDPLPPMPTCLENFAVIPDKDLTPAGGPFAFQNLGGPQFAVTTGGGKLTITVDEAALVAAFESNITDCRDTPGQVCEIYNPDKVAPCLQAFSASGFRMTSFLSFN